MNLSSCGVLNDQHIFRVFWKWWRPFLYILFKRGTPGLHSLFCWFQVIWGQSPVLEMEKKNSLYIHVFRQKKPHITGGQQSTPRVKVSEFIGKYPAAKTYNEGVRVFVKWRECWLRDIIYTSMSCADPFFSKCYL